MGLETATYPNGLNANWPLGTDPKAQGDDHLRLLKSVLQSVFPAGWDDANILALYGRARAQQPAGWGYGGGSAADLGTAPGFLGNTSTFVATSPICFVDCWLNVDKSPNGNVVSVIGKLYDQTAGNALINQVSAASGSPPSAGTLGAAYVPHATGIIVGLTVGNSYILQISGYKLVADSALSVTAWVGSVFNL